MTQQLEQNLATAQQYLARFRDNTLGHFINGEWTLGSKGETFDNLTPTDNTSLGKVVKGTAEDVDAACKAAQQAFVAWAEMSGAERKKILHKLADKIEQRAEEIALVESMDCGQPLRFMRQAAIRGAANFRFFADKSPEAKNGLSLHQDTHTNYTIRTPIGPVGVITPWNTPFMLSTWKIAPALAAGCTVVHKPAEFSPLTAAILAECAKEAGLPDGVWNMVNGFGEVAGKTLTEHKAIKAVAFVGETVTGSMIQAQGAPTLKRVHFELGGKNPVIVFDDADFERALDAVVFMIYSLNGQRCTSSSRLLIQNGIKPKFIEALKQRVESLQVGHPLDPETEVGPLVHQSHYNKVMSYMAAAEEGGATIAVGGRKLPEKGAGNYLTPTLFTDADNTMRIAREEIFGPVLTCIGFDSEEEALEIANDTDYGLSGYIWTSNTGRAMRMATKVEAGMIWVNSENNRNLPSPFGGVKMSGIGRDGGDWSFDFYMETKNVCIAHDLHRVPTLGK
ncbi:5-carboxymethyl-2-hydroxymuconate semialdehyde dehydrogenase [Vibrio vulnificus]|uniref:5-carboxymethyl-2-hydroxymuconate semialdehyde dehydrogenase n=1 Tax=Vibrio vulnificus TaxID=672 RepID=UPI0009B69242|nr:5-carboxymethyl-2-hydroxymuconate semialdehyde dehydrogenase [Vibrio vulnificus]EID4420355.1 5-carboxymethyl-2-hydroxymuconate semialdehyde dehydrogenase [Vibrio vulnificus]ELV8612986.1 5-carboxymethyl-2-hydroxymuconate semialdehyde dehydrogenase [Vibrio vulnificus]MCU8136218.1 5-carboxymethyl-2-hydroxymuconate semialdehyde dehydrogenase [Vibrio vulnificus]OQK43404.1 NAD-dependent aldehyde dehydrogenase [Vibrio vulnificus]